MSVDQANEQLQSLVIAYGPEAVKFAAEELLGKIEVSRQVPAEYIRVLHPSELHQTTVALEAASESLISANTDRELAYGNKAELLAEKAKLQTEIQIVEATAFMNDVSHDGKYGTIEERTMPLNNAEQRDAFRRLVTERQRTRLAEIEADLQKLEIEALKARDAWEEALQVTENVRAKAHVQARLLQFLAGGM